MTDNETKPEDEFVRSLLGYKSSEDRGALAALRSGLGKSPGEAPRMFPYLARYMEGANPASPSVEALFLTGALFGRHPEYAKGHSLGEALWRSTKRDSNPSGKHGEAGVESRLAAALDAHPDDLPRHLEALVTLCESAGEGLDWFRFRRDIQALLSDNEDWRNSVRLKWARDFWQGPSQPKPDGDTASNVGTKP